MAGHWIKWEKGLVRKPEIVRIARALDCTPQHAAACCMQVWEWAEDVTVDGAIQGLDAADVSATVGVPNIGEAMAAVNWLIISKQGVILPNFDRHNGNPSKARAVDADRKRSERLSRGQRVRT